jgi:hypothetical protein
MKEHISCEDLLSLSESQKQNLRYLWVPEKNDLAMASICSNVETDEYDNIEFVIGDVLVDEEHHHVTLRRYKLLDESVFEVAAEALKNQEALVDEEAFEDEETLKDEEGFEFEYAEPDQYFSKEDCLPLMSVGQMIQFLRKIKYSQSGFRLVIPAVVNKLFADEMSYTLEDSYGEAYKEEELVNCLWEAVKSVL